ncbi:MAG: hypothetical protein ACI4ET_14465 [Bilifractor sp.]
MRQQREKSHSGIQKKKRKAIGKKAQAILLSALMAAGLSTSALPTTVQADQTENTVSAKSVVKVGGVSSFITKKLTKFALGTLKHAVCHFLDYSAEEVAASGGNVAQTASKILYFSQWFLDEKAAGALAQAEATAEKISEQLTQMQTEINQEFATVDAQVEQMSTEEKQNAFVVKYDELTAYKTTYKGLSQVYADLVSACEAYSKNQTDDNKLALENAYNNVGALYKAASSKNPSYNSITFNFDTDLGKICELISSYNYNYEVDRSYDPGDATKWGADQGRTTVISSYYNYLMNKDALESEAYEDMKAVINACAGTASYYLEVYQLYLTYEAQYIYRTPAEDLGISDIKSEEDKTKYVDSLWDAYADRYYKIQRAVCQMVSTHESEMDGWMRSYDVDSNIYFTPYSATYMKTDTEEDRNSDTASVIKPGNENTHVNVFKPLGSSLTYALRVPNDYTPVLKVYDTFFDEITSHLFYNKTSRSADYRNMLNAHSQESSRNSNATGYSLIYSPSDLSWITGTADYDNYKGNLLSYLKAHGINTDANGTVPFDSNRDSKSGYFMLTGNVLNDLYADHVDDEDFGWINISKMLDKANLSANYVEVDSDDDLSSKDAVRNQNLTVLYKASKPQASFSVDGDSHVYVRMTSNDSNQTALTSGSMFTSGTSVTVHFRPEDGYYISSLQLVGNRDNDESTNEILYDYLTDWSRGDGTEHKDATADETLSFFDGLQVDSDGYYSLTLPVSYGESTLVLKTTQLTDKQKTYTASIQTSTQGNEVLGSTQFATMTGTTTQTFHAGDTVDIVVNPYVGNLISGLTVQKINADGTTTAVDVNDATADAGSLQLSKNEKFYRFTMPDGDVTISADFVTGKTVTFAENGKSTSTNDLLFFANLGMGDSSESQDGDASVMTYQPGDTVTIGISLQNQHILSKLQALNTETNDPVQTIATKVNVTDGSKTTEVEGFTFTMPNANVSIVAEDATLSGHTVRLDAGEGGILMFADEKGSVSNLSVLNPSKGDKVYVKAVAEGDYTLTSGYPTATQTNDDPLTLKDEGNGLYSFVMGSADVTVHARFSIDEATNLTLNYDDTITASLSTLDANGNATELTSANGATVQAAVGSSVLVKATRKDQTDEGTMTVSVTNQNNQLIYSGTFDNEVSSAVFTAPIGACTVQVTYTVKPVEKAVIEIPDYATLKSVIEGMNSDDEGTAEYYLEATYYVTQDFSADNRGMPLYWTHHDRVFIGTFDGQGHTISNLYVDNALFPIIGVEGTLRNLTLDYFRNFDETKGGSFFLVNRGTVDGCVLKKAVVFVCGLGYENLGRIQNCGVNADAVIEGSETELAGFVRKNNVRVAPDARIYNSYTAATLTLHGDAGELEYDNPLVLAAFTENDDPNQSEAIVNCYCMVYYAFHATELNGINQFIYQKDVLLSDPINYCYYKSGLYTGRFEKQAYGSTGKVTEIIAEDMAGEQGASMLNNNLEFMSIDADLSRWYADNSNVNGLFPVLENTPEPFEPVSTNYSVTKETVNPGSISITDTDGNEVTAAEENAQLKVTITDGTLVSLKAYNTQTGQKIQDLTGSIGKAVGDSVTFTMPAAPVKFTATFADNEVNARYNISRSHYNPGTVTVMNAAGKDLYTSFAGRTVYVKGEPGDGYTVDEVQVKDASGNVLLSSKNSGEVSPTDTENTYTFTMPAQSVTVHVIFKKFVPTLTTQVDGSGTLTVNGQSIERGQFEKGTALQVSIQAAENNIPVKLTLYSEDGTTVVQPVITSFQDFAKKAKDGVYTTTLVMPDQNVLLKAEFQSIENYTYYPVTTKTSGAGSISISVEAGGGIPSAVVVGRNVTAKVDASDALTQYIQSVQLLASDGTVIGDPLLTADKETGTGSATLTFAMPDQPVTVYAVFADKDEPDQKDGVYQISTYEDLVMMAQNIQSNPDVYADADYELTNDIDCSKDGVNQAWTLPIGSGDHPFNGTFEGNDYSIEHLDVQDGTAGFAQDTTGLFGVIGTQGVVQHLSVLNMTWSATSKNAGGIAGVNMGTINYCSSGINIGSTGDESGYIDMDVPFAMLQTTVKGTENAGGIAAINQGKILNSRNNAIVTGAKNAGGIAAVNQGTIDNFYNLGHIYGTSKEGGVAAVNSGKIRNGYNGFAMESGSSGETTGQIVGDVESADITEVYYNKEGNIAGTAGEETIDNTQFTDVQYKSTEEMCTKDFADLLNKNNSGQTEESYGTWTYSSSKNYGYPRIEAAVLQQKTWTSKTGITVTGYVHPDAKLEVRELNADSTGQDATDYQTLKAGAEDGQLLSAYDISMRFANGRRASFEGSLVITIPAAQVEKLQNLKVLHYYNGKLQTEAIEKLEDGSVQVTVSHLSPFALVRTDGSATPTPTPSGTNASGSTGNANASGGTTASPSPNTSGKGYTGTTSASGVKTGDSTPIAAMVVGFAAAAGLLVLLLVYRKKGRGRKNFE